MTNPCVINLAKEPGIDTRRKPGGSLKKNELKPVPNQKTVSLVPLLKAQ
jgi:hypothetical protein